ncbi:hypothetical protein BASA50_009047 [Batrachochytrium salamandrivorans]|uniref:RxLR effector protein n=1 Tax=Batrachochytrium salamandrivorans TaxID=1357716 RepID=A0ABQ8F2P1_9FUNG|nr:hypothetical protein BASA62_009578 [Batrachochytrium salamandrivorans]KAH6591046.1 hypothetical protein BASA50_009047 [Batrachochytrium salamandrivorans]
MIYTSYARIAIIVALVSASVATPVAQDQASVHLEKRTPQGGIEDDEVSLPGSSSGGSHDTHDPLPKGAISESQSTSNCRDDLEKAFEGSGSEGSSTGRSQMPRAQATQLYISKTGRVSPIKEEGSRKNPISDKAYLKLLSKLSSYERAKWGLKPKKMLARII